MQVKEAMRGAGRGFLPVDFVHGAPLPILDWFSGMLVKLGIHFPLPARNLALRAITRTSLSASPVCNAASVISWTAWASPTTPSLTASNARRKLQNVPVLRLPSVNEQTKL